MAVQTQIQTRRGTAATWTSTNPTLAAGEIGFETDTGKFKIGDGTTAWASLAYNLNGGVSTSGGSTITVASGTTVPLTIQNNGTGNSFVVNDVASDTTPFVVDQSGNVAVGNTLSVGSTATVGGSTVNTGTGLISNAQTFLNSNVNWNYGNLEITRNAANTSTPRFIGLNLDGDSKTDTTIGATNSIWGIYDSAPTTGSTSSALNSVMGYGAYAGHRWYTNGTERMRITSGGLVGIGTTPSGAMLSVVNNTAANIGTIIRGAASQTGSLLEIQNSASTALIKVDFDGNVGIGTTFTSAKLTVQGTTSNQASALGAIDNNTSIIRTTAGAALNIKSKLLFGNTDSSTFGYSAVAGYYASYNGANDIGTGLIFGTQFNAAGGTVERMRINQSGDVGIGTTTPAAKLDVNGDARFSNQYYAGKNGLINSAFDISQRGATITGINTDHTYTADRWSVTRGGTVDYAQKTVAGGNNPPAGFDAYGQYKNQSAANPFLTLAQTLETKDAIRFAGKTVTISFYARATANTAKSKEINAYLGWNTTADTKINTFSAGAYFPTLFGTAATDWTFCSFSATAPSTAKTVGVYFLQSPSGGLAVGDGFEITGVQLELGSVATTFSRNAGTIQGELAACQRYYAKSYNTDVAPATNTQPNGLVMVQGGNAAASAYFGNVPFPVAMRVPPTVTIYSYTSSTVAKVSDAGGTDLAASSGATNLIGTRSFAIQNNSGGSLTAATGGFVFHYVASAEF